MKKLLMIPGPTNVPERVTNALTRPIINHRGEEFHRFYDQLLEKTKRLFGTEGDAVILSSSGTGGVEAAVQNVMRKGEKAIVPVYGEFSERLADLVDDVGAKAVRVSADYGDAPSIEQIEEAFQENHDAKALFLVYNETSTGVAYRQIKKAGEIASKHGAFFVVDAISNFGGDELPVDSFGVDLCVTASQKCIAAPPGLALIALGKKLRRFLEQNPPSTLYFNLARYLKYIERKETPFTPVLPLFYGLDEAINIIFEEGLASWIRRHKICSDAMYSAFEVMGLRLFAKPDLRSTTVLAVLYADGVDDGKFRKILNDKFGISIAGGFGELSRKLFRVGCMGIVNKEHVRSTVSAISSTLNMMGVKNEAQRALDVADAKLGEL